MLHYLFDKYNSASQEDTSDNKVNRLTCSNCDTLLDTLTDICQCGQIASVKIDQTPEWHYNTGETNKVRCSWSTDSRWHRQQSYLEKVRIEANKRIRTICEDNNISSDICNDIISCYTIVNNIRTSNDTGPIVLRGTNIDGLLCTCILYVCRHYDIVYSVKEVARMIGIRAKDVTHSKRIFMSILSKTGELDKYIKINMTVNSTSFVQRYCFHLNITEEHIIRCAIDIADMSYLLDLLTKHEPSTSALGCIYMATKLNNYRISYNMQISRKHDIGHLSTLSICKSNLIVITTLFDKTSTTISNIVKKLYFNLHTLIDKKVCYTYKYMLSEKELLSAMTLITLHFKNIDNNILRHLPLLNSYIDCIESPNIYYKKRNVRRK